MKIITMGVFLAAWLSHPLVAQSPGSSQFELTRYEFEQSSTIEVGLTLTVQNNPANVIDIEIPFEKTEMVIEAVGKVTGITSTELWLTKDSVLFERKLPQTALVKTNSKSLSIRLTETIKPGDQITIRFVISVPKYLTAKENRMAVTLHNYPPSGPALKYFSVKPVTIKSRDNTKL
jgi:hypothetical protein